MGRRGVFFISMGEGGFWGVLYTGEPAEIYVILSLFLRGRNPTFLSGPELGVPLAGTKNGESLDKEWGV